MPTWILARRQPGNAAQEQSQQTGRGLTRMPAVTPRLPGPKGVNFQQFCDQLWTDLPGDHHGRESFDTSARFVVGDPGARFGSAAPLEYEVTEEIGRPHWELIFEHCPAALWISDRVSHLCMSWWTTEI